MRGAWCCVGLKSDWKSSRSPKGYSDDKVICLSVMTITIRFFLSSQASDMPPLH